MPPQPRTCQRYWASALWKIGNILLRLSPRVVRPENLLQRRPFRLEVADWEGRQGLDQGVHLAFHLQHHAALSVLFQQPHARDIRSEEHTSEFQSRQYL